MLNCVFSLQGDVLNISNCTNATPPKTPLYIFLGPMAPNRPGPPHSRGFYITHNDAPHSVGLLWTSDQLVADSSTWQHTTLTTNKHSYPRWDSSPQDLRRRPCGYWDRRCTICLYIYQAALTDSSCSDQLRLVTVACNWMSMPCNFVWENWPLKHKYHYSFLLWHSEDRASWYILIIKANKMLHFSTLFW